VEQGYTRLLAAEPLVPSCGDFIWQWSRFLFEFFGFSLLDAVQLAACLCLFLALAYFSTLKMSPKPHDVTTHTSILFIVTAVRTSNPVFALM
jgi:hypothetical protein